MDTLRIEVQIGGDTGLGNSTPSISASRTITLPINWKQCAIEAVESCLQELKQRTLDEMTAAMKKEN